MTQRDDRGRLVLQAQDAEFRPYDLYGDPVPGIAWQPDFVTARARAAALGKPMMVALVAGELDGLC